MKNSKEFWDKNAEKYVKGRIKDQVAYQTKLSITQRYLNADNHLLEFGCGSGATAITHASHVKYVVAIDISDKMIEIAQQRAVNNGIENISFHQGTLEDLNIKDESFDAILALNVLHLLEDVDGSITQVYNLLKSDSVFISSTSLIGEVNIVFRWLISAMQILGLAPHVTHLKKQQLIDKLVSTGFCIEHVWQTSHESVFIVAKKVRGC